MSSLSDCPAELRAGIQRYWPESEWENAANVSALESGWDAFALNDTSERGRLCGQFLSSRDGVRITAELSVGYFQINACNLPPDWEWARLYNADHNCGTAHMLWENAGESWSPWYFTAKQLGLPGDAAKLASLAPRADARLAAALVRIALNDELRRRVTG